MVYSALPLAEQDAACMALALEEAQAAAIRGEVPVGAVLVDGSGQVLARDGNRSRERHDPTAHAEILVLRAAGQRLANYRLTGTTVYVTVEPCAMCAAALVHARVARLVYGADDPKAGGVASRYRIGQDGLLNHRLTVCAGVAAEACGGILKDFFRVRRPLAGGYAGIEVRGRDAASGCGEVPKRS
ncbi:MAG: tRNA adenosine(34) deaminase TadA [Thermodesulfobacteriota bacterium]